MIGAKGLSKADAINATLSIVRFRNDLLTPRGYLKRKIDPIAYERFDRDISILRDYLEADTTNSDDLIAEIEKLPRYDVVPDVDFSTSEKSDSEGRYLLYDDVLELIKAHAPKSDAPKLTFHEGDDKWYSSKAFEDYRLTRPSKADSTHAPKASEQRRAE